MSDTDFESALIITIFGVSFAVLVKLVQDALQFSDLFSQYFWQLFGFLFVLVGIPFLTILAYIYCLRKGKITPLFARSFRFSSVVSIPFAIIKIAVLDGAPYVFFIVSMNWFRSQFPDPSPLFQARYNYPIVSQYFWIWVGLLVFYVAGEVAFYYLVDRKAKKKTKKKR